MAFYRRIFGPGPWPPYGQTQVPMPALLASSADMTGGSIDDVATPGLGVDLTSLEVPATLAQATGMMSLVNPPAVPSPIAEQPPASISAPAPGNVGGGGVGTGLPSWAWLLGAAALVWWFYFRKSAA